MLSSKQLFSLHSWLGLIAGIFLVIIGITGAALVFGDDIDAALHPTLTATPTARGRLPLGTIIETVSRQYHGDASVTSIQMTPGHPDAAYQVSATIHGAPWLLQVDPYTGKVMSIRDPKESFVNQVLAIHTSLFLGAWGAPLVGVMALLLLASVITGTIIYRKSLLKVFRLKIRWKGGMRSLSSDLHRVVGVATLLFNLVMSITGFIMIAPAYGQVAAPRRQTDAPAVAAVNDGASAARSAALDIATEAGRSTRPAIAALTKRGTSGARKTTGTSGVKTGSEIGLGALVARSMTALPGFQPVSITLPAGSGAPVRITGTTEGTSIFYGPMSSSVTLSAQTGAVLAATDITKAPAGAKLGRIIHAVHFGRYGALPVRILYALGGLTPGALSLTGFVVWRAKRKKKTATKRAPAKVAPAMA
jgi:uncharacterized iron-regulated membrane protein